MAVEDLYITRLIDGAALSPDGTEVAITTNLTGRTNLWKVPTIGSWPVQLVNADDRQTEPRWSANGRWIAYSQDKGGNELWDIYVTAREGGSPTNVTNTPDIREQHPVWSRDAKLIACAYKPATAPSYDLAVVDVATHQLRRLTEEKDPQRSWDVIAFSPDGRTLYGNRTNQAVDDGDVYAVDVASGRQTNLTPHEGKQLNIGTDVSSDGKVLLMTSNRKAGYPNAALLDTATRKLAWETDTQWEVTSGAFSPDGKHFTYTVNADGRTALYLLEHRSLKATELKLPLGVNTIVSPQHFSPDGRQILIQHEAINTPNDLWIFEVDTQRTRQLTHMAVASLTPQTLPSSQLVHYASFDKKIITAVLQMPFNLKSRSQQPR